MTGQHVNISNTQLLKGLASAVALSAVITVTVILPAEFNKDLTGIGQLLGLNAMAQPTSQLAEQNRADFIFASSLGPYRSDTLSFVIAEYEGIEVKALINQGNGMSYSWHTDGAALYMDMHGEKLIATDEFESYQKAQAITQGGGIFKAPFDGTHGWYWQNMTDTPIAVSISVSGFYQSLKTIN